MKLPAYSGAVQQSQALSNGSDVLMAAFPSRLAGDVRSVLAVMPFAAISPVEPFRVEVQDDTVTIPSRIYPGEPDADMEGSLTGIQRLILHCLYSRHSDGRVRKRRLGRIVASSEPWVAPFVVQLAGEYVVEILEVIREGLPASMFPTPPSAAYMGSSSPATLRFSLGRNGAW